MKVNYHFYEPDKGFEEIQAKIYNDELKRNPKSLALEVTAEDIKQRFEAEKKDPKFARYALKEDNSPLAYIQASVRDHTFIGYPWAMADCSTEVQENIFLEMLEYVKKKHPNNQVVMGYLPDSWQRQVSFAENRGFEIDESVSTYYYKLEIDSVKRETSDDFETRKGTIEDLDALVELANSDPNLANVFPDDEGWKTYFTNTINGGHTFLVFKGKQLVSAGDVRKGNRSDAVGMSFFSTRPGFHEAWKMLIIELALHSKEEGWNKPLIMIGLYKTEIDQVVEELKELGAQYLEKQVRLHLKD
ncbi:MAG: hypothetical protein ACXAEU_00025 [Candidatus Hodarchaeales archaeon]|jgi:hypothetical protein